MIRTARAYWKLAPSSVKATVAFWAAAALFALVSALLLISTQIAQAFAIQGALRQAANLYPGDYVQGPLVQGSQPNPVLLGLLCIVILLLAILALSGYAIVGFNVLAGRNPARVVGACLALRS